MVDLGEDMKKTFTRDEVVEVRRNYPASPWIRAVYQSETPARGHRAWHIVRLVDDDHAIVVPINRIRKVPR